ncbi:hypothetical protein Xbed_00786 [Xenorhabdus beddingii]|uniref:Uncharacterized protein n=1 Tax=Xenorhabdus beddingii TaxID=40578 RepID=A0A1Y2ST87_9GAMM|nr:hypothetical protein Xbed_00786 [Xenorhabdus beddingii]
MRFPLGKVDLFYNYYSNIESKEEKRVNERIVSYKINRWQESHR